MAADIVMFKLDQIDCRRAARSVAALVFCTPANVSHSIINGRWWCATVMCAVDLPLVIERHNELARILALATGTRAA